MMQKCTLCGIEKTLDKENFYKDKSSETGFKKSCKLCDKPRQQAYYQKNKDKIIKRQLNYYNDNKENYHNYYENNKEEKLSYTKIYYKNNKTKVNKIYIRKDHKRRAKKYNNGGSYTNEQLEDCLLFFDNKCCYSGVELNKNNITIDHIIPISKGGTNYIWNIAYCTRSLNSSKSNKDLEEWYRKQQCFDENRLKRIYEWMDLNKEVNY